MKLKTKTITVYMGEDGQEYDDFEKATEADVVHLIHKDCWSSMDAGDIADVIMKHREALAEIFRRYNKIDAQKKANAAKWDTSEPANLETDESNQSSAE